MDKVTQEERGQVVKELLLQRDQERKERLQALKEEKELLSPNQEKIFGLAFEKQTKSILENIKLIEEKKVDQKNLPEHFNNLKKEIDSLNNYLSFSANNLTNYTVKRSLETVVSFENKLKDLETGFLPKRKFQFKSKKKNMEVNPSVENDKVNNSYIKDEVDSFPSKISSLSLISCGFTDRKNENLKLCNDEISKNDVELRNLDNCTVFLCGNPSTVLMSNITSCRIISGPVSTSVLIENCSSSVVVIACQQLRIHTTNDSKFYIHVTSRAVIEDTHNAQFAPYNLEYEDLDVHFDNSGLYRTPINWNSVDDFHWLASDAPSPNWSEINVDERVLDWTSLVNF